MFFNKPATADGASAGGTVLPWHQDRWKHLDRDPQLTIYTALDAATAQTGCLHIIPKSRESDMPLCNSGVLRAAHCCAADKKGLINPAHHSGFLTPEQAEEHCPPSAEVLLELEPGDVALLHNYTLVHTSYGLFAYNP